MIGGLTAMRRGADTAHRIATYLSDILSLVLSFSQLTICLFLWHEIFSRATTLHEIHRSSPVRQAQDAIRGKAWR